MSIPKTRFIVEGCLVACVLVVLGLFLLDIDHHPNTQNFNNLHYANNAQVSIRAIHIRVFYVIPQDMKAVDDWRWRASIQQGLDSLVQFYSLQFHKVVPITYTIYSSPVIGDHASEWYNSSDTNRGNPHGLLALREELLGRALQKGGDLYQEPKTNNTYEVMGIFYEGVGSSATLHFSEHVSSLDGDVVMPEVEGQPAFLVSRFYLTNQNYKEYGTTIIAHEFGHTLGLQDRYDIKTNQPTSDDIMGAGRFRPLSVAYISDEDKKQLGLAY